MHQEKKKILPSHAAALFQSVLKCVTRKDKVFFKTIPLAVDLSDTGLFKNAYYFLPIFLLLLPSTWRYGYPSQLLVGVRCSRLDYTGSGRNQESVQYYI